MDSNGHREQEHDPAREETRQDPPSYLAVAAGVMDEAGEVPGAAQFCDGFCLTHHPAHTLQLAILGSQKGRKGTQG